MINVNELIDYDHKKIVDLLNGMHTQTFEIAIPKSTKQFFSTNEDIAYDYLQGAYAGQELSNVADEFDYEQVSAGDHAGFVYIVKTKDIKGLAEVILNLSYGFNNGNDSDNDDYTNAVDGFSGELEAIEIACPEHIDTYNEFLLEAEENNNEDDED